MTSYVYQYSKKEHDFICRSISNGMTIYELDIINVLKELNNKEFVHVNINEKKLQVIGKDVELIVYDLELFLKKGYYRYIPKICTKIVKKIKKMQKQKAVGKPINGTKHKITFATTALIVSILTIPSVDAFSLDLNVPGVEVPYDVDFNKPILIEDNLEISANVKQTIISQKDFSQEIKEMSQAPLEEDLETLEYDVVDIPVSEFDEITYNYAKDRFEDIVNKVAPIYGMDSDLLMAMLTFESCGKQSNLLQISWSVWENSEIDLYNFETNKFERYYLSNDDINKDGCIVVNKEMFNTPEMNLKLAIGIFQDYLKDCNHHIVATLLQYNQGPGNNAAIFKNTENNTGLSRNEILSDQSNLIFLDYTSCTGQGNSTYVQNTIRYLTGDKISIKTMENGEIVNTTINVNKIENKLSR